MKVPELKGWTLNEYLPAVIWTLSAANMVMAVWIWSGPTFYAGITATVLVATGGAFALFFASIQLRKHTSALVRIMLYSLLTAGLSAASWDLVPPMFEVAKPEEPSPPEPTSGQTVRSATPLPLPGPARLPHVPADVVALIAQAQTRLASERLDIESCGGTWGDDGKPSSAQCLCDYKLAVTDTTGTISIVEIYEGKKSNPPGYDIANGSTGRACGTNPDLSVEHPPGQTVLAVRTVVKTGGRKGLDVESAVFTPYSDELDTPELREAGLAYWWGIVEQARSELMRKRVASQFIPNRLVTDVIPADHVFLLGIIENVGVLSYFYDSDMEAEQMRELRAVLVLFGANQERTFNWRVSSAKARGPVQVIPDTYAGLLRNYPSAKIISNFERGTTDHLNVAQVAFLHGDEEWRPLTVERRQFLFKNSYPMRWFLAAGYNWNVSKVEAAILACGADWKSSRCSKLPSETRGYLKKYDVAFAAFMDPMQNERLNALAMTE